MRPGSWHISIMLNVGFPRRDERILRILYEMEPARDSRNFTIPISFNLTAKAPDNVTTPIALINASLECHASPIQR